MVEVYAIAQGQITVTGVDAQAAGNQVAIGTTTAGRVLTEQLLKEW